MSALRGRGLLAPITRMGLAPSPHPLGALAIAEVRKVLGFTIPSLLTGKLTGLATPRLAAVMLMLPVPVIR